MGWCHEFGVEIEAGCNHPMGAGVSSCSCPECGTVCPGRFQGGCESVWARGLRPNAPARPVTFAPKPALALTRNNATQPSAAVEVHVNGSGVETARNGIAAAVDHPHETSEEEAGLGQRMALMEIALTAVVGRVDRLVHMEAALTALTEQAERLAGVQRDLASMAQRLATQHQSQVSLEGHVADLGRVLGQLGLEIDDRLTLVEMVMDGLTGPPRSEPRRGVEPTQEAARPG